MEYSDLLQKQKFLFVPRGPWLVIGKSDRVQGWKIHISSIQKEFVDLLSVVLPLLKSYDVSFKIARNSEIIAHLNEGEMGATQIGKAATIYPRSDAQAIKLQSKLVKITQGFHGPVIVTDLKLGDVVYTRYGNFNPIIYRDRLGQNSLMIYGADGSMQVDAYSIPFVTPSGIINPFEVGVKKIINAEIEIDSSSLLNANSDEQKKSKLFGPGYLVLKAIKQHAKGSVFYGIDLRSQNSVNPKIIKQGRQFCLSDEYGRDIRTRLQWQEKLHQILAAISHIPRADNYFEVNGDGYLPLEYIEGRTIEEFAVSTLHNCTWESLSLTKQIQSLNYALQLVVLVEEFHKLGYVHRDITASNVWISAKDEVYLLDLELTHNVNDSTPAFGLGTAGFMSPQQASRKLPMFEDDIYAIGCVLILLCTGIDPRRLIFGSEARRIHQIEGLAPTLSVKLIEIISSCVKTKAQSRPNLQTIFSVINETIKDLNNRLKISLAHRNIINQADLKNYRSKRTLITLDTIKKAQNGLLSSTVVDQNTGLWLSSGLGNTHSSNTISSGNFELRRSINRGVSGAIYLFGRLARHQLLLTDAKPQVENAVDWLLNDKTAPDAGMPGLHFGDAGVAIALAEAIAGGLVERTDAIDLFFQNVIHANIDWPDITHGAAGQGIAGLLCSDLLNDSSFLELAHRSASYLVDNQESDGSWKIPPGVDGMSGDTLTGFAHGVSGIVFFMSEYSRRYNLPKTMGSWQLGANWLISQSKNSETANGLEWNYSYTKHDRWKWWCHGAPGISLTFLRLYETWHDHSYADIAKKALYSLDFDLLNSNLSQCHGLSGIGEIYLDAARVLDNDEWQNRASEIGRKIVCFGNKSKSTNSLCWLVEEPTLPTADFMVGMSGLVHFLNRLFAGSNNISFPLLPSP